MIFIKYFTYDLCEKLASLKTPGYKEFERQWQTNAKRYWNLFENYKNILPKKVFEFFKTGQLSDSLLQSVVFRQEKKRNKIELDVAVSFISYYDDKSRSIFYKNVVGYSYKQKEAQIQIKESALYILYNELLKDGNEWTHNILLSNGDEVFIRFESIVLSNLNFSI